ncbi:MAG: chemotaxis protein CheA [Desulfobacteraceae bacterium]|nr:chemotaxis protein CheA [Desulfobacteraceae bacterium]
MTIESIKKLIDKLSCDFVLADPEDPDSLTGLLPILKQIHGKCMELSLKDKAKTVLKIKKMINAVLINGSKDVDKQMENLGEIISELSSIPDVLETSDHPEPAESKAIEREPHDSDLSRVKESLDELSVLIGGFCPGDIPDLGAMLNCLDQLIDVSNKEEFSILNKIAIACKGYVENMTLENIYNTKPIEEGLLLLKSILSYMEKDEIFGFDYSDVLELLDMKIKEEQTPKKPEAKEEEVTPTPPAGPSEPKEISPDDMEILIDFVSEAEENLDTIEVNLIDLEQDPTNNDIINDIFRPFHTIKGVSGFLSLTKINKLSHTTENLLDAARSGDFLINDIATDAILESVDTLKNLIDMVKDGTQTGILQPDDHIDVEGLRDKLQKLQVALTKGEKMPLGEILVQKGDISKENLDQALDIQKEQPDKKIGEILVEKNQAAPKQIAGALMDQAHSKKKIAAQVKVSTEKLDDLVDYAGELVIAQSMLKQKTVDDPSLSQNVAQLGQIVTNMQNIAMSMRMIPIKSTFMKMIRLVRDLSKKSGKEINLNMVGEDTEIDRNVVDALYEPMVHMIRNSCDHGIEAISDRTGQGKSSQGTITLRAYHKGGHIIIEIEDDGKGLDQMVILEKAKNTGLIDGTEQLTDAQVYDLIMQPGFSTAKEITDVSGRGVGMDVVKSGIEKFRGQLNIESQMGQGTKFTISLPLTLAIIDGMLVGVDDERYVIPTTAIQKAFKPPKEDCFTVEGKGEMVKDRGGLIPVIRLNDMYNSSSKKKTIWDKLVVVVESKEEKRALLIDELLGKDEYVIKSLGNSLEDIKGIAGGAILADGQVGLILDIHGVFAVANG